MVFGLKRKAAGAEWQEQLRAALGKKGEEIVRFLVAGERPPLPPLDPKRDAWLISEGTANQQKEQAQHHQNGGWQQAILSSGVDWLEATRTMPSMAVARFAVLLGVSAPWVTRPAGAEWLVHVMRDLCSTGASETFTRATEAGAWLGYTRTEMIESLFAPRHIPWAPTPVAGDFAAWVEECAEEIVAMVRPLLPERPELWSRVALGGGALLQPLRLDLAAALTSTAKTVRTAARGPAAMLGFDALLPELQRISLEGVPGNRAAAIGALVDLAPPNRAPEVRAWISEHCAADRAASVRDVVAALLSEGSAAEETGLSAPLPAVDVSVEVPTAFRQHVETVAEHVGRSGHSKGNVLAVIAALEGRPSKAAAWGVRLVVSEAAPLEILAPVHLARLMMLARDRWSMWMVPFLAARLRLPTPLEVQAVAHADGVDPIVAVETLVNAVACWPDEEVALWARHHLSELTAILARQPDEHELHRHDLFRALATLQPRPESLTRVLVQSGLTGYKVDQPLARAALGSDATPHIVAALASKKAADRVGAANWLRELRDASAEAPLRAAIAREQHDGALAEMLRALEAMGVSLDEYLAPDKVLAQATAALAKKNAVPPPLRWLSFESLPTVRWNDGTPVDPRIFQWFAATAVRAKSVEPSTLLRRLASQMRPDEAQHYALALYDTWVARDLVTRPRELCEAAARDAARRNLQWASRWPNEPAYDRYRGLSEDQVTQLLLPRELAVLAGSATDSKGVLAVCAALGGPDLAGRTLAYLKKWRGYRVHQGMAMLGMLAGTELPAAIQVVLTVSQRFRPKGLQDEAGRLVQQLADRRGWTVDDLADRTVPRGGFDDDGRLVLDYGDRRFVAHLRDDLSIDLTAVETGKSIKALPDARQGEDEAEVKAVQNDLKLARKEVKATATLQPERLYMAMCTERRWSTDDFRRYLLDHPVLRRLAARLVWVAVHDDGTRRAFRPLTDGTLVDIEDDMVELAGAQAVHVAHEVHLGAEAGGRWLDHFRDYQVAPLFAQFGRPAPPATEGSKWTTVEGHMISAKALRGVITKVGWQLGAAQDGGMVCWVERDCAMAGLTAVMEISGVPAYTDDSVTALLTAYFVTRGAAGYDGNAVPFDEVPPILRLETYREVLQIAAGGTGYDPDYKKKATFG